MNEEEIIFWQMFTIITISLTAASLGSYQYGKEALLHKLQSDFVLVSKMPIGTMNMSMQNVTFSNWTSLSKLQKNNILIRWNDCSIADMSRVDIDGSTLYSSHQCLLYTVR